MLSKHLNSGYICCMLYLLMLLAEKSPSLYLSICTTLGRLLGRCGTTIGEHNSRKICSKTVGPGKESKHRAVRLSTVGNNQIVHTFVHNGHHKRITLEQKHWHGIGPNIHDDRPSQPLHQRIVRYNNKQRCPSTPICLVRASASNTANYCYYSLHFKWP